MKKILFKAAVLTSVLSLLAAVQLRAAPVTIDFDSFSSTTSFGGGVEDGVLISGISGPVAVSGAYLGAFSGPNAIHHQAPGNASFSLTLLSGGDFTLTSFRSGSAFGGANLLNVSGFNNGLLVGTDSFNPNPPGSYFLFSPTLLAGINIDQLVFNMGPAGPGPTHIDNIALNTVASSVPEGASTLGLLGLTIMVLATLRRRVSGL